MHSGSCFCNEQLNKNVKYGKEYFTLNVSNIVLFIFKSFITFCWGKKEGKKNRILNRNRNILVKKSQLDYFPKSFSPTLKANLQGRSQYIISGGASSGQSFIWGGT